MATISTPTSASVMSPGEDLQAASKGYEEVIYAGKDEQMRKVADYVREKGLLPSEVIEQEVHWFYG